MKIAIITDTHYGVRGDNIYFLDSNKKFMDNIFFPTIDSLGIDTIIHLGDLVDRRKYINIQTAKRLREDFIQPIKDRNIDYHQILGNHDVYYKNTNEVNAVEELYGFEFPIYYNTSEVMFDGLRVLFVPWINQTNKNESFERIKTSNARICMGHLEIQGFEMFKGNVSIHGEDRSLFERFHSTLSGHFHHRSTDGSIYYLGSHSQFIWSDYGDDRGFHIFDTETLELTFIKNPYIMFSKIIYDDEGKTFKDFEDKDFSSYSGTYGKVIVKQKNDPYLFDLFCNKIDKVGLIEYQIVEENTIVLNESNDIGEAESTIDIFKNYINKSEVDVNKDKLQETILEIYNEAMIQS